MPKLIWTITFAVTCVLSIASAASAQEPVPCPSNATQYTFPVGTLNSWQTNTRVLPAEHKMKPCETLVLNMSASYLRWNGFGCNSESPADVAMTLKLLNASGQSLAEKSFVCSNGSCSVDFPEVNTWPGHPLPGTRGEGGLADKVEVSATSFSWCALEPVSYELTVTKQPRPSYNQGGDSFATATTIATGTPQYGSAHPFEVGQFFKVSVAAGQMIFIKGEATGHTTYGSTFTVDLYDSNQQFIQNLVNEAAYGTVPITVSALKTFINTSGSANDYYIKITSLQYPTHDFAITVATPRLTGPTSITRGDIGTFEVEDAPGLTISNWTYEFPPVATWTPLVRSTNLNNTTWSGPLVASGTAKATVGTGVYTISLEKAVTVIPRTWQPFAAVTPVKVNAGFSPPCGPSMQFTDPVTGQAGVGLWRGCLSYDLVPHLATVPTDGPNAGVKWLAGITDSTSVHWGMHTDAETTTSAWWIANCGNFVPGSQNACTGTHNGTGFIDAEDYRAGVERHEIGPVNSHQRKYADVISRPDRSLSLTAESIVGDPASNLAAFHTFARSQLNNLQQMIATELGNYEPCSPQCDDTCTNFLGFGNVTLAACPAPNFMPPVSMPVLLRGRFR